MIKIYSKKVGFSKNDRNQLSLNFKHILLEEYKQYLDIIKKEEESDIEGVLEKDSEQHFSNLSEDIRCERSLILLLSLIEPDILKQSNFTDDEINIIKRSCFG